MTLPLILTAGDPAGIAGEITLKAWAGRQAHALPVFAVHGDVGHLQAVARDLELDIPIASIRHPREAPARFGDALPVIALPLAAPPPPGTPSADGARQALDSLNLALKLARKGQVDGIVTNPVSKAELHRVGFTHPGQTEFFAAGSGQSEFAMMLSCPGLRVVPQTIHIPLRQVADALSTPALIATARLLEAALRVDFAIPKPRIAVAGLNPHAGEGGVFGREEQSIIVPAIAEARAQGLDLTGPHAADTLFHAAARNNYDAVLCMYHDQALIPIKTLGFDQGVNTTLGLPIVRTSPDHGTAFNIAGQGIADPGSLIAALQLAASIAENRAKNG